MPKYRVWDDQSTVRKYGRLTQMLVARGRRRENLAVLAKRQPPVLMPNFALPALVLKPDINVLVLESFTDPRLIKGLEFSRSPQHESLDRWLGAEPFDLIDVPIYGGGTPQAEFELLTGAPALSAYGNIEFNNLTGAPLPGLVAGLAQSGYQIHAEVATSPRFYNSARAYKSLGFERVCFVDQCEGLRTPEPYKHMPDADLLAHLAKHRSSEGRAVFRYALGMYGHVAFERHPDIRPDVVSLVGKLKSNQALHDLANQFYYRTKAIADFLSTLHKDNEDVLTLVVGDHLAPIFGGEINYQYGKKKSIALLLFRDKRVFIDGMAAWQLPYVITDLVANRSQLQGAEKGSTDWYHYVTKLGVGADQQMNSRLL